MRLLLLLLLLSNTVYAGAFSVEKLSQVLPQSVPVKGGRIEYYRFGHGSPLVLITGYVSDVTSWNRQFLAKLASQHELIVFNNRNVGGSVVHSPHAESKDLAEDTAQLIQALALKRPAVLGISMGGMIALKLAVSHPDQLSALILVNTMIAGKRAVLPDLVIEKMMEEMPVSRWGRFLVALKLFFGTSGRLQTGYALAFERFEPKTYSEVDPVKVIPIQRQMVLDWLKDNETGRQISKIKLPVMILNGGADKVVPPTNSYILARVIPHATLSAWQDGGHGMLYQYPEEIATKVNQFISARA